MSDMTNTKGFKNNATNMDQKTLRILRRLCEAGSVLAVAEGMETAVVCVKTRMALRVRRLLCRPNSCLY